METNKNNFNFIEDEAETKFSPVVIEIEDKGKIRIARGIFQKTKHSIDGFEIIQSK